MFTRKSVGRCRAILTALIVLCNEYIEEANIPTVKFDRARSIHRREACVRSRIS